MKHPGSFASLVLFLCCASPLAALAQDAPREQRISTSELREQVRRRPQGVVVPVEITKQGDKVVLQTADSAVAVSNADAVAQQVRQMPVQAAVIDGPGDSVQLQNVQLQATKRWNDLAPAQRAKYRNVDVAQRRMSSIAETALGADATEADLLQLKRSAENTERQLVQAYKALDDSQRTEQRELVEQLA